MTDSMTPRPAEEVAREMIPEPEREECGYVATLAISDDGSRLVLHRCWSDVGARSERAAAVEFVASAITRAREEGAAAERARFAPLLRAARRWHATMSDDGGHADEQMAADLELTEAVEALASEPQQPRDLAGRIRALIQEYAGRWSDAEGGDRTAYHDVLCDLRRALESVRRGEDVRRDIDRMSDSFRADLPEHRVRMKAAADELEAIVRESGER